MSAVKLHPQWLTYLQREFEMPYMKALKEFLKSEQQQPIPVFPPSNLVFNALNSTPLSQVKVVILGQDPYHGPGQAHGLAFSVPKGIAHPPSLHNIFKELGQDLQLPYPQSGDLSPWAQQGVLLLNTTLTVRQAQAGSHQKKGWETFTDRIINLVNEHTQHTVFMLWGAHAQQKEAIINTNNHCVLKAPHPSPLSAHRGFLGCKHFSKANAYLIANQKKPVEWAL